MTIEHAVVAVAKRRHPISEDAYAVAQALDQTFAASVVDGHGFHTQATEVADFAQFVALQLVDRMKQCVDSDVIPKWFDEVQHKVEDRFPNQSVGAAAACLVVDASFLLRVAYVGDCRLFRYTPECVEGVEWMTKDHTPECVDERLRLEACGQFGKFRIIRHGADVPLFAIPEQRLHFVDGPIGCSEESLSYTRGFGHSRFRPALTHVPEIRSIELVRDTPNLFALCSDGGTKIVRRVFRRLLQQEFDASVDLRVVTQLAEEKITEKTKGPKHDATIIFFKVSP
ncbi:hypothetical protein A2318_02935 [Candidatus Uhrbacteria bacterium RIFOXYB2_FULL_45_11]|uniref:PPM-type phosphatase domain-containing protein n=1 Tax=Candidatus Uhrbacteria bacterium RIFOXYB2_FULL_45_11 TaxID=1802421 RepID=A0A1F7W3B0_9BACT|nr:MAG: hypothetical protein A2318_02935 [Candidatus Uhrbacteria bacterium RIFOXYB2_FULL_45_11]